MNGKPQLPEDPDAHVFVISVAAQLAGMHAQTLRTYDRLGLVKPERSAGGGRRYSTRDVDLLREVQRLSQDEGVNLAGIKRIIDLEQLVEELHARVEELADELLTTQAAAAQPRPRYAPPTVATWCRSTRGRRWSSGGRVGPGPRYGTLRPGPHGLSRRCRGPAGLR